jgi:hypothetical protein
MPFQQYFEMIFLLWVWHAIADFPLQGDYLSKAKDPTSNASLGQTQYHMLMHCLIHAGGVFLITGYIWFALVEIVLHFAIDTLKCRKKINYITDQVLHLNCKTLYVIGTSMLMTRGL